MSFWLALVLANLAMGFLIGYCFRAANEPGRRSAAKLLSMMKRGGSR